MSKHIGQVKWFNNKIGYGFVTLLNEETTKDVFVHHMNIKPVESNYRTLKIGEFVEFELDDNYFLLIKLFLFLVTCLFFFSISLGLTLIEYELFSLPYFDLTESKKSLRRNNG